MAKDYLSKEERQDTLVFAAMSTWFKTVADKMSKRKSVPSGIVGDARRCATYASKVLEGIMAPLSQEERNKVIADSHKYTTAVQYKDQALAAGKAMQQIENTNVVDNDELLFLLEHVIEYRCKGCTICGDNITDCRTRDLLCRYDIEPFEAGPKGDKCIYSIDYVASTAEDVLRRLLAMDADQSSALGAKGKKLIQEYQDRSESPRRDS